MQLAQNLHNFTPQQTPAGGGPSVWEVLPNLCVCWLLPTCLLPLCNWGKHALSDRHFAQSFLSQVEAHAALLARRSPCSRTAGCSRGAKWSGRGLIRLQPLSLFYLSVITHLHPTVHPSTHLTHRLPSTNTCSHYRRPFLPKVPSAGRLVSLSLHPSPRLLILGSQHWPQPNNALVCMCACVLLGQNRYCKSI